MVVVGYAGRRKPAPLLSAEAGKDNTKAAANPRPGFHKPEPGAPYESLYFRETYRGDILPSSRI
jgi:hypothetical protein